MSPFPKEVGGVVGRQAGLPSNALHNRNTARRELGFICNEDLKTVRK